LTGKALALRSMAKKAKLPHDTNKKAKSIVDMATGETDGNTDAVKAAAAALGRMGGLKGGPARAKKLNQKQRSAIAKKAAAARWGKKKG
jgi:hypothetical protein